MGKDLDTGSHHYRAFIGPPKKYDLISAMQFNLLTFLGLREDHFLLDIGCGSLRGGKLFIPYLLPGRYFGIEPEKWLVICHPRNEKNITVLSNTEIFHLENELKSCKETLSKIERHPYVRFGLMINKITKKTHIQSRSATQEEATSSGVLNPRHFLGRLLINDSI